MKKNKAQALRIERQQKNGTYMPFFASVVAALKQERRYQNLKWPNHHHTLFEWLGIMETILNKAKAAWFFGHGKNTQALHELRQLTAVGVAAMEACGIEQRDMRTFLERTHDARMFKRKEQFEEDNEPEQPQKSKNVACAHCGGVVTVSDKKKRKKK